MKGILRTILGLAFLAGSATAFAGETTPVSSGARISLPDRPHYAIEHFGERYGLSAITVISMVQDAQGFLWIGSQTGVYRYDGASVAQFGVAEGLPGEHVMQLLVAPDGTLWARTRKGLARLEGQRFVPVAIPPEAGNLTSDVQSFAVDAAGRLIVSVERGLLVLDRKSGGARVLGVADGLPGTHVEAILRGPDDCIWLAAGHRLAQIPPGSSQVKVLSTPNLPDESVVALLVDGHNQLWVRTENHLATLNATQSFPQELAFHDENVPGANSEGGPVLDRRGDLMLPTSRGLYRWHENQWQVVDHSNGLTSSALFSALEDREGTIWVGLAGAGLDRWPGSHQWSGWIDDDGLPDSLILSIARDARARLWVGTNTSLSMWDGDRHRWQVWNQGNGMVTSGTRMLLVSKDGGLWASTAGGGITSFDGASAHPRPARVVSGKEGAGIVSTTLAPDGAVWWNGESILHIVRRQGGRFVFQEEAVPEANQGTTSFLSFSPKGVLWTGGPDGLSRFDGKTWQKFGVADGLLDPDVRFVAAVTDNDVWIGYGDENSATRARVLSAGKLRVQHVEQGSCLLGMDRGGNAWLEMQDSAARLSPDGMLRKFIQSDGLLWNDTNCGAFWQESDGTILIGTSHGLARFDPRQEELPRTPPVVALTRAEFAGIERSGQTRPRVPYKQGTFVAQFAALTFRDPDRVRCRYRLDGLESAYTETAMREARYSALPPGDYTFEISCGSEELGWSVSPATFSFTVLAPWWRNTSVEIAGLLIAGVFVMMLIRLRTRRLEAERKRLEAAVAKRSGELARANRELQEASLTDPLTGIRNRRFFSSMIAADANQATRAYYAEEEGYSRDHRDLIFYLIDVDHFKEVNDAYGHDAGDDVLVEVARRLSHIVRQSDFLIRWGGEEFLIVCRAAERKTAAVLAEKILAAVAQEPFRIAGGKRMHRTCSVGWAAYPWKAGDVSSTADEVLRIADRGLYRAKELGRNRAVGMAPVEPAEVLVTTGNAGELHEPAGAPAREILTDGPR